MTKTSDLTERTVLGGTDMWAGGVSRPGGRSEH